MSIATAAPAINVPFHGAELYVVNHNGEPYTPMKPIIDGMGMDWASQFTKLKQRFKTSIVKITMQLPGDDQRREIICLALRKLAGWLNTISPNKVRREIRERVIRYQEECDDVLYEYWTKGQVTNPRKTSTDERTPLRDAINMLVGKRGIMYPEAYSYVHQRFNVAHIDELPAEQLPVVIEYVHRLALEGEFLGKQEELPAPKLELPDITMEWWYRNNMQMQHDKPERRNNQPWNDVTLTPLMISGDNSPSPSLYLIRILEQMGFDMVGPRIEVEAMRSMLGKGKQKIRVMGDSQVKYLLSL
ncbi:phage antirepressor N-terminal domain-containing protein [Citrobacter freundii]|nr:phage antirepressor N-terminal domain-containing protein [Citrobacter freundii]